MAEGLLVANEERLTWLKQGVEAWSNSMFNDSQHKYDWMLDTLEYDSIDYLLCRNMKS
jgi:hypothetical protein